MIQKVLLILNDLYAVKGGGQTVYRKIIEATPDIQFTYFRRVERNNIQRPANVRAIPLLIRRQIDCLATPTFPQYKLRALAEADQIARSVAGHCFDVVEIPDFYTCGSLLRDAFAHHGVKVGRFVLAMHGNISISHEINWWSTGENSLTQKLLEEEQFANADIAYAISSRYLREWKSVINRDIHYIDPGHFVRTSTRQQIDESMKPSLYCVGRSERLKGNDLFVELVRWLQPGSFEKAAHVGEQVYSKDGVGSETLLHNIAMKRDIKIDYLTAMKEPYERRSIFVLPVRYDTLNLVALEALFSGCLVAISSRAGVCDYLDEVHPKLPYLKIHLDNFYETVAQLQDLIDRYEFHQQKLLEYLAGHSVRPQVPLNMKAVYESASEFQHEKKLVSYKIKLGCAKELAHRLLRHKLSDFRNRIIKNDKVRGRFKKAKFLVNTYCLPKRFSRIAKHNVSNKQQLREKLVTIYANTRGPLFRCNFWSEIASIERILQNEAIAVTYELRIFRLLGEDRLRLAPRILNSLKKLGYLQEAEAFQAICDNRVYEYLKKTELQLLKYEEKPFERIDDRRTTVQPKVSVIVSLYNAEKKLGLFLTALAEQTLVKQGTVELILIDSGSPTNEREVIEAKFPDNAVYLRSASRETIQAAWNRGIGRARAPYLVFLGVDETLYPEALELLANELDLNPQIDWVMANSLVTAVEESGEFKHDIMLYDRSNAMKDLTYLETCYVSWVGGMYRKSIHERFGYYDETFRAAGDTEFKCRVLPHIQVKFIPKVLGLFLNYPDGNTTASVRAEIEDLRAWYIHRTPGGIQYAFENRPIEDAEKLLCNALGYRKSYCKHKSCDIEYAYFLSQYIKTRKPNSLVANNVEEGLRLLLKQQQGFEFAEKPVSGFSCVGEFIKTWMTAKFYQNKHKRALTSTASPCYSIINDNRYEQHSWLWKS